MKDWKDGSFNDEDLEIEAQKGEVSCSKAHSKFMAELELELQLICPPHPSLQHDYKWQILCAFPCHPLPTATHSPCSISGTTLLRGAIQGLTPGRRSPLQGLRSVRLTSGHSQSTLHQIPLLPHSSAMPLGRSSGLLTKWKKPGEASKG